VLRRALETEWLISLCDEANDHLCVNLWHLQGTAEEQTELLFYWSENTDTNSKAGKRSLSQNKFSWSSVHERATKDVRVNQIMSLINTHIDTWVPSLVGSLAWGLLKTTMQQQWRPEPWRPTTTEVSRATSVDTYLVHELSSTCTWPFY
jgi:hypothetical protein